LVAHELGHSLGFFHTQSRHDRDSYITVDFNNIRYGWRSQFVWQSEEIDCNYNITYDCGTVMHYGATEFVKLQIFQYNVTNIFQFSFQFSI
uniref:Metalloendopeptidase n=1 Tax=Angiostrongylus cantonensis TaxID=6313 RepID=A0A0K0DHB3_ANGCA